MKEEIEKWAKQNGFGLYDSRIADLVNDLEEYELQKVASTLSALEDIITDKTLHSIVAENILRRVYKLYPSAQKTVDRHDKAAEFISQELCKAFVDALDINFK